jgi:hypothetical protein
MQVLQHKNKKLRAVLVAVMHSSWKVQAGARQIVHVLS